MTVRNGLDAAFDAARREGRGVLIPYLTAGYPELDGFVDLAVTTLEAGADALELGVPFSDPVLDGPSIQRSQQRALAAGVTPPVCLQLASQIHARTGKPLISFGAYNPILAYGVERYCRDASQAGMAGLIAPDVPFEEQGELRAATAVNLHLIQLVAPTSSPERLGRVCAAASGFVYCMSVAGVTGARAGVAATARPLVERVRACTAIPVAVGFGISTPDHAREVASFADGVVVGSALINLLADTPRERRLDAVRSFIASLRDALKAAAVS
ncbi:MAG: tryptophan synthase subunit alpha [Chloroflexi bacterium]|nr:tryptophan synthase subunit alpha [Chloroflexota bacterium]